MKRSLYGMKYDYFAREEEYGWLLYDTEKFIVKRVNSHYISELDKVSNIRKIQNTFVKNALSFPTKVFIDITNVCNLQCIHCHSDSTPKNDNEFSLEKIYEVIDQCYKMGVFVIKLSGGELLLYKHIEDVIKYIREKQMAVSMITNGTIMSENIINMILQYKVDIGISLDGSELTHNSIRGNGVYEKVLNTINKLLGRGIKPSIQFTLMPDNLKDVQFIIQLTKTLNIPLKIRRVKPLNRALKNNLVLSHNAEYIEIIQLLNDNNHCEIEDVMKLNQISDLSMKLHTLDCGAGTRILSIRANGDVLPCAFLGEEFVGGNIYTETIKEIWQNSINFRKVRNLGFSPQCLKCHRNEICHGACIAMSKFFTDNLSGGDPDCLKSINMN